MVAQDDGLEKTLVEGREHGAGAVARVSGHGAVEAGLALVVDLEDQGDGRSVFTSGTAPLIRRGRVEHPHPVRTVEGPP